MRVSIANGVVQRAIRSCAGTSGRSKEEEYMFAARAFLETCTAGVRGEGGTFSPAGSSAHADVDTKVLGFIKKKLTELFRELE